MAERDAGTETCDGGGQTLGGLDDKFGGDDQTVIRMMQAGIMDDSESESEEEEEKGSLQKMGGVGGTILEEKENINGGKEEEEVGMEKGDGNGPIIFEMSPRNSMDLNDHWPPDPWSLQYLEREMFCKWDSNPCWDIELMPGNWDYEDDEEIIWEDDVWHLRDIKEVPTVMPLKKKIGDCK